MPTTESAWWLAIFLNSLAVYRVTRLVTRDTITQPFRDWLVRDWHGWVVELLQCPWCFSIWVAAGATVLTYFEWGTWKWIAAGLAFAALAGLIAEKE